MEDVPLDAAAVQPAPQWGIYWGTEHMLVSLPRLEIADAIETKNVKTGFNVAYLESQDGAAAEEIRNPRSAVAQKSAIRSPQSEMNTASAGANTRTLQPPA